MKKRELLFLLVPVLVFAVSFALWSPGSAARESFDAAGDEWVGYFLALFDEDGVYLKYDGKYVAAPTEDGGYDFGIPGSACFLTITEITPGEPEYEPESEFNYSIGSALGGGISSSGMHVYTDDNGTSRYELEATMTFADAWETPLFTVLDVYRTGEGEYYAERAESAWMFHSTSSAFADTHSVSCGGKTRGIRVSLSPERRPAVERAAFIWLDGEKHVLARAEYEASSLPETLCAPEGAALLIVRGEARYDGEELRTVRTVYGADEEMAEIYVPDATEGLAARKTVWLSWED